MTGPMLRISEVADELAVSKQTVRRLVHAGLLHAFRVGPEQNSHWRVRRDDLDNYVRGQKVQGDS